MKLVSALFTVSIDTVVSVLTRNVNSTTATTKPQETCTFPSELRLRDAEQFVLQFVLQ